MAKKQTKKPANAEIENLEAIVEIASRNKTIEVEGRTIELSCPSVVAAKQLRKSIYEMAGENDPTVALEAAILCVQACINGISEKLAGQLVLATGGEFGELATVAMNLSGLGRLTAKAIEEGHTDFPTS